jgi:hypothetical protein
MMAMSAAPLRSASAQSEGTVKDRSYLPRNGPCVKLQTKGAVLRYCTMEMRSLAKFGVLARRSKYTGSCNPARRRAETLKCLQDLERLERVEREADSRRVGIQSWQSYPADGLQRCGALGHQNREAWRNG